MDALEAIRTRRSVRKYKTDAVPKELIETIVDAGRLAASARNEQPWLFVVTTDRAVLTALADISDYATFLRDAPACILVFCLKAAKYFLEDGAAATQNMLVAARALGLGACWIAGDKKPYTDRIRSLVGAPETYRLISYIAVGFSAELDAHAPHKKPLDEVLRWEGR
ncbi:nitroreductase family protein [bacterium]|nr:nitroreductase family protein [bacterium]